MRFYIDFNRAAIGFDDFDLEKIICSVGGIETQREGAIVALPFFSQNLDCGIGPGFRCAVGLILNLGKVIVKLIVRVRIIFSSNQSGLMNQIA